MSSVRSEEQLLLILVDSFSILSVASSTVFMITVIRTVNAQVVANVVCILMVERFDEGRLPSHRGY